jgi:hypothetical protein
MIPEKTLKRVRQRARRGNAMKLLNLLDFRRDFQEYKDEKVLMQAYGEWAEAMMISPDTLRRDLATIRNYTPERLAFWLAHGVSFEHLETANVMAEKAKKTPVQLLNECISLGGKNGRPMTVNELISFANGENTKHPILYRVTIWFDRLGKSPALFGWDAPKTQSFNSWLEAGRSFFL